ncbi:MULTISPECIES: lysophospholipid acyltransferase family protein [Pseudoalteromonas]|uniref:Lipid A biosynthesis acyltransferase n=1 Tax=Pseudoalteromonas amylolytica TaxID=1859457 RepID=A0A1S1MQR0_9GAMM|nr:MULTISPECIES: lysophospholipid acyltransferase family protein [Pseudoalteromonas]OHU87477.1 hypothetical protein BFC16_08430 [Pseudoalteromonas sp. JW3]OHU90920.1 hypothetical protein BET10_08545 [Pseudoalteromonas amylolytica]
MITFIKQSQLYITSLYDIFKNRTVSNSVFDNCKFIGFSRKKSIAKVFQYFLSKRTTQALYRSILKGSYDLEQYLDRQVSFSNEEYWKACKAHSGPIIFVTPHYGPFAIGCMKICKELNGLKNVHAFYDPPEKNSSTKSYKAIIGALGYNFAPIFNNNRGVIKALRALKQNQALTMMPDVFEINGQTIYVPFFSHLSCAMTGTAYLARKSSALIVHAYVKNSTFGRVVIDIEKPFKLKASENPEHDLYVQTCHSMSSLEEKLKKSPEHWVYLPDLSSRLTTKKLEASKEVEQLMDSLITSLNLSKEL